MKSQLTFVAPFLLAIINGSMAFNVPRDSIPIDAEVLDGIRAGDNKVCAVCVFGYCPSACATCSSAGDGTWYQYTDEDFTDGYMTGPTTARQVNRAFTLCTSPTISYYAYTGCSGWLYDITNTNDTDGFLLCTSSAWGGSCTGITSG